MININIRHCLIFLSVLISQLCYGGGIDSLKRLLSETHDVERKIEIHTLLAKQYQVVDLNEARNIANKALNLSTTTNTTKFLGEIYGLFGDIAVLQDSLTRAQYYYEIALKRFEEHEDLKGATGVTFVLGNIALTHDNLPIAMSYYLKTVDYANMSGLESWLPSIYLNIGTIYHKSGAFKDAQKYFTWSLEGINELGYTMLYIEVYNNLGLTYLEMGELETAEEYFIESVEQSLKLEAYIRAGRSMQNMTQVYQRQGNHTKAIDTLLSAKNYLERENPNYAGPRQPIWATNNIYLGLNYFLLKKDDKAYKYLLEGLQLSRNSGQLKLSALAMQYLSEYWERNGNPDSALIYFKMHKTYQDSLNTKDNIRKLAFQEAQFRHDEELLIEKQEREKEATQNNLYLLIAISAIISLVLLSAVLSLLLKLGRNKIRQGELEQNNLRHELEVRNKELTTHLMYQVKNNEFILNISKKLKEVLSKASPENKGLINGLIKEIELDSHPGQWEEFEVRFQQVHTDFYKNIGKEFPDITLNELRLCAFLRLNMNTKDIAAITYQSTNSITVARWRLRQKFDLNKEESLSTFLTQY